MVKYVAQKHLGVLGPGGADLEALPGWIFKNSGRAEKQFAPALDFLLLYVQSESALDSLV